MTWLDIKTSLFKSDKWRPSSGEDDWTRGKKKRKRRRKTAFLPKMTTKSGKRKGGGPGGGAEEAHLNLKKKMFWDLKYTGMRTISFSYCRSHFKDYIKFKTRI